MNHRALGFAALLSVIGASIVFGMIVGGRLNAPRVMLAAPATSTSSPSSPLHLQPASRAAVVAPDFAEIVKNALPAVVSVTSTHVGGEQEGEEERMPREEFFHWFFPDREEFERRRPQMPPRIGEGSGFIISPDGYILTNYHVVEDSSNVRVRLEAGKQYAAKVVGADPAIDLALLKINPRDATLPALPLGDSDNVRVGEWVIAIGNPHDFQQTVTVGVISGKERRVPIGSTDLGVVSFLQTDAAINFGNSGGPLLDARGNVVGINTAIRRVNFSEGIGFALPISQAVRVMDQLRQHGHVRRGYLGITMNREGLDEDAQDYYGLPDTQGVIVSDVQPDGPADQAGVRPGDVIRKLDGEKIKDNLDLIARVAARAPGDKVRLEIFRSGTTLRVEVPLVNRDESLKKVLGSEERPFSGPREQPESSSGLGLTVENLSRESREQMDLEGDQRGVLVTEVDFNSEAADEGVRPDMIITAVNDQSIESIDDWDRALKGLKPNSPVKLNLLLTQPGADARVIFIYLRAPDKE